MRIRLIFAWYDFWVGIFWDRQKRALYLFLIPMIGIVICRSWRRINERRIVLAEKKSTAHLTDDEVVEFAALQRDYFRHLAKLHPHGDPIPSLNPKETT